MRGSTVPDRSAPSNTDIVISYEMLSVVYTYFVSVLILCTITTRIKNFWSMVTIIVAAFHEYTMKYTRPREIYYAYATTVYFKITRPVNAVCRFSSHTSSVQ